MIFNKVGQGIFYVGTVIMSCKNLDKLDTLNFLFKWFKSYLCKVILNKWKLPWHQMNQLNVKIGHIFSLFYIYAQKLQH